MRQEIRFVTSGDGTRIAWARHGHGPPSGPRRHMADESRSRLDQPNQPGTRLTPGSLPSAGFARGYRVFEGRDRGEKFEERPLRGAKTEFESSPNTRRVIVSE
jgi:hypothetical protein